MELILIGALIVLAVLVAIIAVPLIQRRRRSGSVRAVVADRTAGKEGQEE